jgi:S-adenosylmethionine:tRNA ribosyltransferase-isomerase
VFSLYDYDFELPQELIAQRPVVERDRSRLLIMNRATGELSHGRFGDLVDRLAPSDVLVINNTEVIPGRLLGRKDTGGRVEVLILNYADGRSPGNRADVFICECLVKSSKRTRAGTLLRFEQGLTAELLSEKNPIHTLEFRSPGDFKNLLYRIGRIPLPPYIKRDEGADCTSDDRRTYQTVYASRRGAIAAPTAGFHFTAALLKRIEERGIKVIEITLHIGYGTFLPVRADDIRDHTLHCSAAGCDGKVAAAEGNCNLFIYPGYRFRIVAAMVTNFHLPKSTLLMLVSAFAGRENILAAYREAIAEEYRFYSYGDAMFIA